MALQESLDAFAEELVRSGKIPEPVVAALQKGIADQVASGSVDRALRAGDRAPTFALPDPQGAPFSSSALLRRGPYVVSFYRGVWCPYCNLELQALEAARVDIEARGASLIAVSMQNAANSRKSARENGLGFPILVDVGGLVAQAFGLRYTLSPELVDLHSMLGNDLQAINGEGSGALPIPGRYVVGRDGIIAYAEVNPDYTHRPDPSDLLPILEKLARSYVA